MAPDDDTLVSLDRQQSRLVVSFEGLEYTLSLLDPDSLRDEPELPDISLSAQVVLEGRQLSRGITATDMVDDHLKISVSDDSLMFTAEGDVDDVELEVTADEAIDMTNADVSSMYSLQYLTDMSKPISNDAAVTLDVGDEYPLRITFTFAEDSGVVTYMLAPRIEED